MSIMEQLRSGSDSAGMQVIMALVVVSFVFWYVKPSGDKSQIVAEVNGSRIMDTEYSRMYRDEERNREYRYQRALSEPEKQQLQDEVKTTLIQNEVLLQEADQIGIEVSDTEVAQYLLDIEAFYDENDEWDLALYERYLKRRRVSRSDFEADLRSEMIREKLKSLVFMGATVSAPVVRDTYVEANTAFDISYVRVRPSAFYDDVEVTTEDRTAWVEENEDRIRKIYERDFDLKYNHPQEAQVRMIHLAVKIDGVGVADLLPRMRTIREEIQAGADFVEMARKWSEHPSALEGGDLTLKPVTELSEDIVDAVEDLEVGQISDVKPSDAWVRLYKLDEKKDTYVDGLDEVRDSIIEETIQQEKAPILAATLSEELLAQWKENSKVPEVLLSEKGLISNTTGMIKGSEGARFGPPPEMLSAARLANADEVLPQVYESSGVLWVGQVTQREEPDMDAFEVDKEEIREQTLIQRRISFYQGWVTDLVAQADVRDYMAARRATKSQSQPQQPQPPMPQGGF